MLRIDAKVPVYVRLEGHSVEEIALAQKHLTYTDKQADFALRRFRKARYFDAERYADRLAEMEADRKKCLLYQDDDGFYTLAGLANNLNGFLRTEIKNEVLYPKAKQLPWNTTPHVLRPYQDAASELLLRSKHGSVEIGTGLGKSRIILEIARTLGLKTVVMCPSTSIADQLLADFTRCLGKKYVGQFYGGKKDSGKLVTVAISASLTRIEPGTDHWSELSGVQCFIADESHLTPASTLHAVCTGLFSRAPYRFFFSGTQTRGDGAELLLEGIIGPVIFKMTVAEGVDQGYLAKPQFTVINTISNDSFESDDANEMTRRHLFYNPVVNKKAAAIANAAAANNHPVLILIDEIEQFAHLEPLLRHKCAFAFGTLTKDNERHVQKQYRGYDNTELVKKFNAGEIPILIGTSAISTGTDIQAVKTMIFLRGGKSPIDIPQSVGRCTRLAPGKDSCAIIDFDVMNVDVLHRHASARVALYREIYDDVEVI